MIIKESSITGIKIGGGAHAFLYALLLLITLFPAMFQPIKYGILSILCAYSLLWPFLNNGKLNLHRTILLWFIYYICLGLAFSTLGVVNDAPNISPLIQLYVIFPLVHITIILQINEVSTIKTIDTLLVFVSALIAWLVILQVLVIFGAPVPGFHYVQAFYTETGLTSETSYTPRVLSSLIFLIPFVFSRLILLPKQSPLIKRAVTWATFISCLVAALLARRQALLLVLILSPLLIAFFASFLHKKKRRYVLTRLMKVSSMLVVILLVAVSALALVVDIGWDKLLMDFTESFDPDVNESAMIRIEQLIALLNGLKDAPVFGAGLGMGVEYIRDPEAPWNYELRYFSLLYQVGVLGFILYGIGVAWMLFRGIYIISEGSAFGMYMFPMLCGFCGALIAEATNPYLNQFGHLWMIFFPLATINLWLIKNAHKERSAGIVLS